MDYGTPTLKNSTVSDNTAGFSGGGILDNAGAVTLNNSKVSRNQPDNCVGTAAC